MLKKYIFAKMTTTARHRVTGTSSLRDESFTDSRLGDYRLILQAGFDGLAATVYDRSKSRYIAFENFGFQNVFSADTAAEAVAEAVAGSNILKLRYRDVSCAVTNNLSTLVPSALYDDDRRKMYLKFNAVLQGDEFVMTDDIRPADAKNVFAVPFLLKSKLDSIYNRVSWHHYSTALIEGILNQNKNLQGKQLYVHIQSSHFEIIIAEANRLIYYNTFNYHAAEDLIYYLLFACEQLGLNVEKTEAILLGEIERTSAIYPLLTKYIRTVKFGSRSAASDFSYQLQSFPPHHHFVIFSTSFLS